MTHLLSVPRRAVSLTLTLVLALAGLLGAFGVATAAAATPPVVARDTSTGVTADVLPTAQINPTGWVEDQAIAGDTVYAGGLFSSARPAGAVSGTSESPRNNLLAYSLSSGDLSSSFAPNIDGEVRVLALSPDKSRLYVGGDFTSVDGATHNRLVAFTTSTGKVDPSFAVDLNGPVYAVSATSSTVYVGGQFTSANGNNRGRLAAFRSSDGAVLAGWTPKTDGKSVKALLVAPGGNVIAGGSFATLGNIAAGSATVDAPGSGSIDPTTGAIKTWNVNKVVKQYGSDGSVLSLKTDGTTVFGSGFWYGGTESNFEGVWAASPTDGTITWIDDCHGDTYDTTAADGVVYTASHHHDCSNVGAYPEQTPKRVEWRATAFTTAVGGDVQTNALLPDKFKDFTGYKAPSLVSWFPQFDNPKCATSGCSERLYASQPTITVESSGGYVVMGGQFPTVNGVAQQGLVRFGKPSAAPDKEAPRVYTSSVRTVAGNVVRVTASPWDRDDLVLSKVELFRNNVSVWSATNLTAPWWKTSVAYTDTSATAGTAYSYKLKMTDPDGNVTTTSLGTTTPSGTTLSDSTYSKQVLADNASGYWRLDDAAVSRSDTSKYPIGATDSAGAQDLTLGPGVSPTSSGAVGTDGAVTFDGSANASAATATPAKAPQTFSAEAWFKSSSTTGGQVIGYGNAATLLKSGAPVFDKSYYHDRQVYLTPAGQLMFYVNPGSAKSITSPKTYNDGKWHQVVASLSSDAGMVLYVDGAKVSSWSSVKSAQDYRGYWRIGGDNPAKLPGGGAGTGYLTGAVDDVSVYPSALSAAQVADHYKDATGATPTNTPTVAFTTKCQGLSCAYDASSSTPEAAKSPTIASYTWNLGDGTTLKGAKASHVYHKAATYDVRLTVQNSDDSSATAVQSVEATGNSDPVASFSAKVKKKKVKVDAASSLDYDGTIVKYSWNFGDGATSTAKKVSHSYVGKGVYPVRLVVTDDQGSTSSTTTNVVIGKALARDTFGRTVAGWGSAEKGGAWSTDPTSAFAVTDGRGELTLSDAGDGATALLGQVSSKKANVVGEVRADKIATGQGTTAAFLLRQRGSSEYRARVVLGSGGSVTLVTSRVVDGKQHDIKSVKVKGLTYKADSPLRVRATISSAKKAKIKMTVWRAGTEEPKAQLSAKDSTKALRKSGTVGIWGFESTSATNAPVVLGFDNLLVTSS